MPCKLKSVNENLAELFDTPGRYTDGDYYMGDLIAHYKRHRYVRCHKGKGPKRGNPFRHRPH
jgi:hypothetical protein